jgi:hypothetical protein
VLGEPDQGRRGREERTIGTSTVVAGAVGLVVTVWVIRHWRQVLTVLAGLMVCLSVVGLLTVVSWVRSWQGG